MGELRHGPGTPLAFAEWQLWQAWYSWQAVLAERQESRARTRGALNAG